jgi:hypothetical protein
MLRLIGDEFAFGRKWQAGEIAEIMAVELPSVKTVSRQYFGHQLLKLRALMALERGTIRK